jgi:uncharacterized membrane protein YqjE
MNYKVTSIDHSPAYEANKVHSVGSVLHEIKEEAGQFVHTRVSLLKTELRDKLPSLKAAGILAAAGALLLLTAYLLFTAALFTIIAIAFQPSEFRWFFALIIVGVLWAILGGVALAMARQEITQKGLMPKRTLAVLKGDKIWLEKEARGQQ